MRQDGSDILFGGAGTDISRNNLGDASINAAGDTIDTQTTGHSRDADMILGDNGNIFRLVGVKAANSGNSLSPAEPDGDVLAAVLERVLEELGEDEGEGRRLLAGELDRLEPRAHLLALDEPLDEHRAQPVHELAEVDVVLAMLRQGLVHRGDGEVCPWCPATSVSYPNG